MPVRRVLPAANRRMELRPNPPSAPTTMFSTPTNASAMEISTLPAAEAYARLRPCTRSFPLTFETAVQPDGTPIGFTGFPLHFQIPLSSVGNISGYVETRDDGRGPRSIIMDKEAWPGASGSPLYLANGKVVGLLRQRGVNEGNGRTIGLPSRLIQEFLSQNAGR